MATSKVQPKDIEERRAGSRLGETASTYGPNFGKIEPAVIINLGNGKTASATPYQAYWYEFYKPRYLRNGITSTDFILALAQAQSKMPPNSAITIDQAAQIGVRFGIDPAKVASLTGASGGGGGGVSKTNQIKSLTAIINDMAGQLGIGFSPEEIGAIATTAQAQSWGAEQIVDHLTANVNWYKLNSGTLKTDFEKFKTAGKQYLVNLSDESARDWAAKVTRGEMTEETALQNIREAAKIANPWLANYIDRGLNPVDVLSANRDFIAQNLEIDPISFDLMDSKTLNLMTVQGPDGQRKLADQSEMILNVRSDDRWKNTNNAKEVAASMSTALARLFGRSAF